MRLKKILLLGAGKSAHTLIKYLLDNAAEYNWQVSIGDKNMEALMRKVKGSSARVIDFSVHNETQLRQEVGMADIVISMLPARFHPKVANTCLDLGKSMVTASYVSPELQKLDKEAKEKNILFLNEIGLDPGLDHISAMKVIDEIRGKGGEMINFESFAGGLLSPESENNPWKYKFTWNPRNVVLAGQGTVKFIQEGRYKYIPYHKLFRRTEIIEIDGYGKFEGYANRDSLKYLDVYNLRGISTIYRGTLRRPGFCRAWNAFVQLGATDDSYVMEGSENFTHRQFINSFLSFNPHDSVELKLMHYLKIDQDSDIMEKLKWLGIFEDKKVGLPNATPAQILQHILEKKWKLSAEDKDMIVMWHLFDYKLKDKTYRKTSSMVVLGEDHENTAMAKTVGLPLGIAIKMILEEKIKLKGIHVPITPEIYEPILEELTNMGISFTEKEEELS
ncbi:saccharopine dehydrogenase C-terminal domain-containing protein [Flammeovirgaceae bacterium SG7u.111]|nr:saccharopine dehydrogenase C-terminal domain-containing protein [Flammeovirgaceae bacterium SG7u.132]WPO35491.1 saccharopine dehydrogenase C-terminal domain-containing protein [Flammeovirgaceae bacterium SG7u.111]